MSTADEVTIAGRRFTLGAVYVAAPHVRPYEPGRPIPYLDEVALEFPELVIVGGHIGYPWTEEMIALATKYPNVVTTWAKQQDKAIQLIKSDPAKASAAVGAELNLSADEAKAQLGDLIFLTAKEQVGKDYLGGGLADNLIASAQFNKSLGKVDQVQPDDVYRKAVVTTFAQGAASS